MGRTIFNISLLMTLFLLVNGSCKSDKDLVTTILIDLELLNETKIRIEKGDLSLKNSFEQLIEDADKVLNEGPYSVTDKEKLPPSGNKHDYASYSRYWWPDPNKTDGLPYIRLDGQTNPSSQSLKKSDRPRIGALGSNTETLGLAYYLTGNQKYAKKTAEFLRVWFLNEETFMNPNLNHSQCRTGHNNGSKSGVLDGRLMVSALEGSLLIKGSSELSIEEYERLRTWANDYFQWLTTNELALQESVSNNNHGSYYDAQTIYFALYSGNNEAAEQIANKFIENRLLTQIKADGSMPKEMARTRPLFYSIYNLHAMFLVAHLAEKVEVDIWKSNDSKSRLRAGLDYLVPYTDSTKIWPQPTIGEANRMELFAILHMANQVYPEGNYLDMAEKLPLEKRKIERSNLAFPLMR